MGKKEEKTNVMRILDKAHIAYQVHTYPHQDGIAVDGMTVAMTTGQDPNQVFKTLVAQGSSKNYYVFCLPVAETLAVKRVATLVGEKSLALVAVKDLLSLTGYIRGGCSPIGMKKKYPTVFHHTADFLPTLLLSAGKIGFQVEVNPKDLLSFLQATTADIIEV